MANAGQDQYRTEIINSLHNIGGLNRVNPAIPFDPHRPNIPRAPRHSPDDMCSVPHNGRAYSFLMEIKTAKGGILPFGTPDGGAGWRQGQIEWAMRHYMQGSAVPIFIAVMFDGLPVVNRVSKRLYLVPFSVAFTTIEAISPIQKTIPYSLSKQSRLVLREKNLCAENLWADWQAPRATGGWNMHEVLIKGLIHEWVEMAANAEASSDIKTERPA